MMHCCLRTCALRRQVAWSVSRPLRSSSKGALIIIIIVDEEAVITKDDAHLGDDEVAPKCVKNSRDIRQTNRRTPGSQCSGSSSLSAKYRRQKGSKEGRKEKEGREGTHHLGELNGNLQVATVRCLKKQ
jgi:hypothetical protein